MVLPTPLFTPFFVAQTRRSGKRCVNKKDDGNRFHFRLDERSQMLVSYFLRRLRVATLPSFLVTALL
jgi:hypothetical protein